MDIKLIIWGPHKIIWGPHLGSRPQLWEPLLYTAGMDRAACLGEHGHGAAPATLSFVTGHLSPGTDPIKSECKEDKHSHLD